MNSTPWRMGLILLTVLTLTLLTSACASANPATQATRPVASIGFPQNGAQLPVGQVTTVKFSASDVAGIVQIEMTINGQPVYVQTVNPPSNAFVADYSWTPEKPGSYVIQLIAFSLDGDTSDPVQALVTVGDGAAAESPPPVVAPGQTVAVPPSDTPIPLTPAPPVSTGDQVNLKASATALIDLNVRTGPGKEYDVIGRLAKDQTAEIVGRDQGGYWWQIVYPAVGSTAWIAAGGEFSTAVNTGGVPVISVPTPSVPLPAPADTPIPTPDDLKPTIYNFTADRYTIAAGENVTLSWDLANAQAAYLRYDGQEEGVVAPGNKTVAPTKDTVYTLAARNNAGETTAALTIVVSGSAPTPVPVRDQGRLRVVNDQSLDFDQGVVEDGVAGGADFYWDGQRKVFTPKNGADGALLSAGYGDITLSQCLSAGYGHPIAPNPAILPTGCYKTSEGRYGKFYVSEWDFAGNLTVEWLTWEYR